jgi:hypothetical protein
MATRWANKWQSSVELLKISLCCGLLLLHRRRAMPVFPSSDKPSHLCRALAICAAWATLLLCGSARAIDTTWTLNGSGQWTDEVNWSNGQPLDSTYDALIDDGDSAAEVVLTATRNINTLRIGSNDSLRIESATNTDVNLTAINGIVNEGVITLTGTSSGWANLSASGSSSLTNSASGILRFAVGGTGFRELFANLINNGTVEVNRATIFNKSNGSYKNANQFIIAENTGVTVTTGTFEQAAGILDIGGNFTQSSGTFSYSGGVIDGEVLIGPAKLSLSTANAANFRFTKSGATLALASNSLGTGQSITFAPGATATSAAGFTNNGSILCSGTASLGCTLTVNGGPMINGTSGEFRTQGGTANHTFSGRLTNAGGLVQFDAPMVFSASGNVFQQTSGTWNVNNSVTASNASGQLGLEGGTLNYTAGTIKSPQFNYLGGTIAGTPLIDSDAISIGPNITNAFSMRLVGSSTLSLADKLLRSGQTLWIDKVDSPSNRVLTPTELRNEGSILFSANSPSTNFVIQNGPLVNAPTGLLHFRPGASKGLGSQLSADIENQGRILTESLAMFVKADQSFVNTGELTITSAGAFTVFGTFTQLSGTTHLDGWFLVEEIAQFKGGRLYGTGYLNSSIENVGASFEPGNGVGLLQAVHHFTQQPGGRIVVELGGAQAGTFDVFSIAKSATLAGSLEVQLVDIGSGVFTPAAGDVFPILTAAGGITGQFENLILPELSNNLAWKTLYSTNSVSLVTTLAADFNGDFTVDAADYIVWRNALGTTVARGTGADGDFDGQITPADIEVWRSHFGQTVSNGGGTSLGTSVPEPRILVSLLWLAAFGRGRRVRPLW